MFLFFYLQYAYVLCILVMKTYWQLWQKANREGLTANHLHRTTRLLQRFWNKTFITTLASGSTFENILMCKTNGKRCIACTKIKSLKYIPKKKSVWTNVFDLALLMNSSWFEQYVYDFATIHVSDVLDFRVEKHH